MIYTEKSDKSQTFNKLLIIIAGNEHKNKINLAD